MSPTPARGEPYWNPLIGIFHIFRQLPANKISKRWQHPLAQIPICRGWKMAEASQGIAEALSSRSSWRLKRCDGSSDAIGFVEVLPLFAFAIRFSATVVGVRKIPTLAGTIGATTADRNQPLTLPSFFDKKFRFFWVSG